MKWQSQDLNNWSEAIIWREMGDEKAALYLITHFVSKIVPYVIVPDLWMFTATQVLFSWCGNWDSECLSGQDHLSIAM